MSTAAAQINEARWWTPQEIPRGHTLRCGMGPLTLQVERTRDEWRVAWKHDDETDAAGKVALELQPGPLDAEKFERYAFGHTSNRLTMRPMLADRSVVVRPRQRIFLPSCEETTLYLSSPVYLHLQVGDPPVTLRELPMVELSDTWFGPDTREGELCYSGRTQARQSLAEIPRRAQRALTAVHIRNDAPSPLPLERFSLPVPVLSVYGASDGTLWTQGVSLLRSSHSDMAAIKVDKGPPRQAGPAELISGPRRVHERGALVRAFDALFGD
jgi:hypothetical protein